MVTDRAKKDVVIVGGGPAGMSAAIWCAELGLETVLVERFPQLGGQLHWIHNPVGNYLGGDFENGTDVCSAFERSLSRFDFYRETAKNVISVNSSIILDDGGGRIDAKAIVIATGVRRRTLGVPGEMEFSGKGILESGAKQRETVTGGRVAVIGGGDAALENALILAECAESVILIHRRDFFSGREEFLEAVENHPKIDLRKNAVVESFEGGDNLEAIRISSDKQVETIAVDYAIVRIGVEPNSELVGSSVAKDERGYIIVDAQSRTTAKDIWAIGDVANPVSPTIATAVGTGATCAKSIAKFLRENE